MTSIDSNRGKSLWRIDPGDSEGRTTKLAKKIDNSEVGNADGKISIAEVDKFAVTRGADLERAKALGDEGSAQVQDLEWDVEGARMLRDQLASRADTSLLVDVGRSIAVRTRKVLTAPFDMLMHNRNVPVDD